MDPDGYDIYTWFVKMIDGRKLVHVKRFDLLSDGNKVIILFGEQHRPNIVRPDLIDFASVTVEMMRNKYCPELDIFTEIGPEDLVEQKESQEKPRILDKYGLVKYDSIIYRLARIHRFLVDSDPRSLVRVLRDGSSIREPIGRSASRICDPMVPPAPRPPTPVGPNRRFVRDRKLPIRLHYVDFRETVGMIANIRLSDHEHSLYENIGAMKCVLSRIVNTLDSILNPAQPGLFGKLIRKQIHKVESGYIPGMMNMIDQLKYYRDVPVYDYTRNTSARLNEISQSGEHSRDVGRIRNELEDLAIEISDLYILSRMLKKTTTTTRRYTKTNVAYMGEYHTKRLSSILINEFGFRSVLSFSMELDDQNEGLRFPEYRHSNPFASLNRRK